MKITAQIMGVFAIVIWVISIQQKNKSKVLLCQTIANFIYGIQYLLLGAFSASTMNLLSFLRSLVFYDNEKKKRKTNGITFIFFVLMIIILGILSYQNPLSLIPIGITLAYSYSVWQNNLQITRLIFLVAAFIWLYYNFQVGAYTTMVGNALEIISGCIAYRRFHKKGK